MDCRIHADIDQALAESPQNSIQTQARIRRSIMRSPMLKIAAAAVIVIAVILGLSPVGPQVTFADVINPILNAQTIILDFVTGDETNGVVIHDIISGNRIRRTLSNADTVLVLDLDAEKMLVLDPQNRNAAYVGITGPLAEGTQMCLDMVRTIVAKVEGNPEIVVQDLGRRELDGVETIGFQVKDAVATINLWADLSTATPKRIELRMGDSVNIFKNIEFDAPVSDSQVSMEVPQGYTLADQTADMGEGTEGDLVITLGLLAKDIGGGAFPDQLSVQNLMQRLPEVSAALEEMDISAQDKASLGMHFGKAAMFIQLVGIQGEWHYAGKGIKFGDAGKAVFWYRRDGSSTYRVVYGDLTVKELALDQLSQ